MVDPRPLERRQLTVMFCDMVASTALSLRLDPEELTEVIQGYRDRCGEIVSRYGGTVARYLGDAVLAYFGYPRAHEDDAERAIRAGLAITKAEFTPAGPGRLSVHIGIATGIVVVGTLPLDDLSAIGSALNLAARLQDIAGPGEVVVSAETRRLVRGLFDCRDLGQHDLKGFDKPIRAWRMLGERRVRSRFHALRDFTLTPLVDRQLEVRRLQRCWELARAGQGQALLLSAEPGAGKSRLGEVVAKRIVGPGCLRLWFYCSPDLQSSPLAPLARQLTLAAELSESDDDNEKLRKLAKLIPEQPTDEDSLPLLANLLAIRCETPHGSLDMSPQRQKQRLFEILMRIVEALASRGPMLLIVEDLHWIDPTSDELIGILIDRMKDLPILALLTTRPEFQSHWDDRAHLQHIVLNPLERQDTIKMIGYLCADTKLSESTVDQIADRTDGLPLFIEDLTREVLESADLQSRQSNPSTRGVWSFAIPATLNDSLMSRLDRLGPAKTVAQTGAAIGREFSHELLSKVAHRTEEQLREELQRLVDAGILKTARSTAITSYTFKHALVRDAAYSSLLKKEQAVLHARIARVMVEHFPELAEAQPEAIAHQFAAANEASTAVPYLVKAAKVSARRSGFAEALAHLENALDLLLAQAKSRERTRLEVAVYRTLGGIHAEYHGFSSEECGRAYTMALERCRELGDTPDIFAVLSGLGSFEITRASFAKCRALAEECLALAGRQQATPPFVMGHLLLGGTLFLTGELPRAREHLEEALHLYDQDPASARGRQVLYVQDQKSTGLCYLALALTIMGYLKSGARAGEAGLQHSRTLGGLHTINFSLCYLAAVHHIRGDAGAALECATRSLESSREQGFATWIGISQMIRGASLVTNGNREEGLAELVGGMEAHTRMEASAYQPFAMALLAEGLLAADRRQEALCTLERALAVTETTEERFYAAELFRLKGEVLANDGRLADAEASLREAITTARGQQARLFELRSVLSLARILDGRDKQIVLRDMLAPVHHWFTEHGEGTELKAAVHLLREALPSSMRSR